MVSAQPVYSIWPGVIPGDKTTTMTITTNQRAFLFPEDACYQVVIIPVGSDDNYYAPHVRQQLEVTAKGGVLTFDHHFSGEQEHAILLNRNEKTIATFTVFSLYADLYALSPLKGDLHSHSCRSDGRWDPAVQASYYREQGYDFTALTDHNRYYPGGEIDEAYQEVTTGLTRVFGEEVHCPGSVVHIVHVGGRESVAARYVHDRENYDREIEEYMTRVPAHILEAFRERYAKAMWATDAIHAVGGLAIFPHPFWRPKASLAQNLCDDHATLLLTGGMFDAYELIGAMGTAGCNRSVALWADLRAEGLKIPVVGSSDTHNLQTDGRFSYLFTVCFARENTNEAIIEAVKQGLCVAVEAVTADTGIQYRCYGSLRLVTYAQFLLANFFPRQQQLCAGLGIAMRSYIMEEADGLLVDRHAALVSSFRSRFFGITPALLPSVAMLEFEEKWRNIQLSGPKTRGSAVDDTPAKKLV